jgi:hypothetical protein
MKDDHTPDKSLNQAKSAETTQANTNTAAQRTRLHKEFKLAGPKGLDSIAIRHDLNILSPAPRVHELRHNHDLNIATIWTTAYTPEGYPHRVARYVLMACSYKGEQANV